MRKVLSFIALLFLLCSLSCSSDKGNEGAPQSTPGPKDAVSSPPAGDSPSPVPESIGPSLRIMPETGTRRSTFSAVAQGFAIGDAKVEWLVNGKSLPVGVPLQLKAADLRKGDKIQVKAVVDARVISSDVIEIRNSPPEITDAKIILESGSAMNAEATAQDADGDDVTLQYEWTVNRDPAGSGRRLARPFKRDDHVTVKITPYDGQDYGRPVVLERSFTNLSPVVRDQRKTSFDGKIYTYQISAYDPDGDTLSYSLKSGPQGMTVDASTGLVRWEVPKDFVGKAPAIVVVSDGHGGETLYNFNAIISLQK